VEYLVRRLTPDECCRLQGYPDGWCKGLTDEHPSEDEIAFWVQAFEEHRKAAGKQGKPKTRNQIIKWLSSPGTDSAEYRAYGNSVAVPCVFFILAGIAWAEEQTIGGEKD
jgi:DNA (cytosine-5)-methyltransferase 1